MSSTKKNNGERKIFISNNEKFSPKSQKIEVKKGTSSNINEDRTSYIDLTSENNSKSTNNSNIDSISSNQKKRISFNTHNKNGAFKTRKKKVQEQEHTHTDNCTDCNNDVTVKMFFQDILILLGYIFNCFISILRNINKIIIKSNFPKSIYTFLVVLLIYGFFHSEINFYFYKKYNTYLFDRDINNLKAQIIKTEKKLQKNTGNLESVIENELMTSIYDVIKEKKKLCIETNILGYKENIRQHSFIPPEQKDIDLYQAELTNGSCSVDELQTDIYKLVFTKIFGLSAESQEIFNKLPAENNELIQKIKRIEAEVKKEEKKELVKEMKKNPNIKSVDTVISQDVKPTKSKNNIKAIFCISGHGSPKKGNFRDEGAISRGFNEERLNMISERKIIDQVMPEACDQIKKIVQPKGIKVYEIAVRENVSLVDKIKKINEIAKENGYDEKNSIGISLHYNMTSSRTRSGVEVYFSQQEKSSQGYEGDKLAENVLYEVKKYHKHGNLYRTRSSEFSRFKQYGILDNTKPTIVLIELGFLSNKEDVAWALDNISSEQQTIIDGITKFIK